MVPNSSTVTAAGLGGEPENPPAFPIKIDLRDLTEAHIAEAMPHAGQCYYTEPCIIGTLVPEHLRCALDAADTDSTDVLELVKEGFLAFPTDEQAAAAAELQNQFDESQDGWDHDARKWIQA